MSDPAPLPGHRTRKALELAGLDDGQITAIEEYLRADLADAALAAAVAVYRDAAKRAQARVDTENASRVSWRTKADAAPPTGVDHIGALHAALACEQRRDTASSLGALYTMLATMIEAGKVPAPGVSG
jgi:hypothetical protein